LIVVLPVVCNERVLSQNCPDFRYKWVAINHGLEFAQSRSADDVGKIVCLGFYCYRIEHATARCINTASAGFNWECTTHLDSSRVGVSSQSSSVICNSEDRLSQCVIPSSCTLYITVYSKPPYAIIIGSVLTILVLMGIVLVIARIRIKRNRTRGGNTSGHVYTVAHIQQVSGVYPEVTAQY